MTPNGINWEHDEGLSSIIIKLCLQLSNALHHEITSDAVIIIIVNRPKLR
jgi:exonuclease I